MQKMLSLIAVVALTFAFGALSIARAESQAQAEVGKAAPNFSLQDQDGKTVSLDAFKGKIVVLEWFNEGCPYVKRHYEQGNTMNTLVDKYASKSVIWLAINSTNGKNNESNKKVFADWKLNHPILNDVDKAAAKAYGAKTTPHMFVIDKDGKLAYSGAIDNDPDGNKTEGKVNYVEKAVDELLNGQPVSEPKTKSYGCGVKYAE
ncbi:MAG TPA: redoxin domain-containing protein [Tepidisphaeraceae bacterium]|jgi:peroxiredoxin